MKQGAFPGPRGTYDGKKLALTDAQVDVTEYFQSLAHVLEGFTQAGDGN
jgi:hypothetical protein